MMALKTEKSQFINLLLSATWAEKFSISALDLAKVSPSSPQHLNILSDFIFRLEISDYISNLKGRGLCPAYILLKMTAVCLHFLKA